MITAKEAYEIFTKRFPEAKPEAIFDWNDFWSISPCREGDMSDENWKIYKDTGKMVDFSDYLQYSNEVKLHDEKYGEGNWGKEISVKDL